MCYVLGSLISAENQYSKLKMKQFLEQPTALLSVWGLNIVSFLNDSLPFLQFASLVLAIIMSSMSIVKMIKGSKKGEETVNNDPIL